MAPNVVNVLDRAFGTPQAPAEGNVRSRSIAHGDEKEPGINATAAEARHETCTNSFEGPEAPPDTDAQRGVQKIEAVTTAWSSWGLAAVLINIWLIFLTNGFRISILFSLLRYVTTSEFQTHSLLTAIQIVADAMAGACYIPTANLLDVWGRAEGFALVIGSATLGPILMASAESLAVFCAAQVFYAVGFAGIIYTVAVLAADVTSLKNRGIAFAFTSSPYMITAFAG